MSSSTSAYEAVRKGKLVLKGEKVKKSKKKRKRHHDSSERKEKIDEDALQHGGWWKIVQISDISGSVCIQFGEHSYIKALNNGLFKLGTPHKQGEGPAPEEILTAFQVGENKIALKSGYGKYVTVEKDGIITGRAEAISCLEQWEPIFRNDCTFLQADDESFMTIDPENDSCITKKSEIDETKELVIRSCGEHEEIGKKPDKPVEEIGNLDQVELNYVKKFQKFQDKKIRIDKTSSKELKVAKNEGVLHEKLLDRRSKMKADRYCK